MSSVAEIREAIVALHRTVPNVGHVHKYERYAREEGKFRDLYVYTPAGGSKQIRGWWWRRINTREASVSTGTVMNVHTWECRGYMALNDQEESELTFDALVEALRDAVRDDPTFGGVCEQNAVEGEEDGVQVADMGPVTFCGVLCHSAVLRLNTWSYL